MDQPRFQCKCCRRHLPRRTQDQRYCERPLCQRTRKNAWRRDKYSTDPEYRTGHRESTEAWLETRGGAAAYHREYRRKRRLANSRADRVLKADAQQPSVVSSLQPPSAEATPERPSRMPAAGTSRPPPSGSTATGGPGAKSDAIYRETEVIPGRYELCRVNTAAGAKRDAILVDLSIVSIG